MAKRRCPNCLGPIAKHPQNSCMLAMFIQVIRERGEMSERKLRKLHAKCNVDALWDKLAPIIDDIEEGEYTWDEEPEAYIVEVGYAAQK